MGTTAMVLELLIAATTHASELAGLLATAKAEGRDVSAEELAGAKGRAAAALDALEGATR